MRIRYGPAGTKGVTTLMAVGDDAGGGHATLRTGTIVAIGLWGLGALTGSRSLRQVGLGGAIALFVVDRLQRRRAPVPEAAPPPDSADGCAGFFWR